MLPSSHEWITEAAVETYRGFARTPLAEELGNDVFREALLRGVKIEDGISIARATNWHFYPANDTLRGLLINPTSRRLMSKRCGRIDSMKDEGPTEELFTLLGRILHHIQDMSTPTHVVPVYHGPNLKDPFEDYLEDYGCALKSGLKEKGPGLMQAAMNEDNGFLDLYDAAAKSLLSWLNSVDTRFTVSVGGKETEVSTGHFWKPFDPQFPEPAKQIPFKIKGFGSFGPMGCKFGEETIIAEDDSKFDVPREVYFSIASRFVCRAMEDTLRAFRNFERWL